MRQLLLAVPYRGRCSCLESLLIAWESQGLTFPCSLPLEPIGDVSILQTRASYPTWSHGIIAKAAGLPDATIAALQRGHIPSDLRADEAAAVSLAAELLEGRGDVSDATYAIAAGQLGVRGIFEVIATVGFYRTLATVVNTFKVPVPPSEVDPFGSSATDAT